MSHSQIRCPKCSAVLGTKHHSGRLKVESAVVVVLLPPDRAELTCPCGEKRVIDLPRLIRGTGVRAA